MLYQKLILEYTNGILTESDHQITPLKLKLSWNKEMKFYKTLGNVLFLMESFYKVYTFYLCSQFVLKKFVASYVKFKRYENYIWLIPAASCFWQSSHCCYQLIKLCSFSFEVRLHTCLRTFMEILVYNMSLLDPVCYPGLWSW